MESSSPPQTDGTVTHSPSLTEYHTAQFARFLD